MLCAVLRNIIFDPYVSSSGMWDCLARLLPSNPIYVNTDIHTYNHMHTYMDIHTPIHRFTHTDIDADIDMQKHIVQSQSGKMKMLKRGDMISVTAHLESVGHKGVTLPRVRQ